ncbi:hypothetical protein NEPAR06_0030 [Nematocida parisii]|uniref:Uncharacterized protein n=1 Tax=Nematocida parisii (strain ERTm3) TaxID=935791 RepID=I3EDZ2_NEMP3|nr:uncharacterized protein NEPG_00041 [Nematocida parisii ERTm1]EIJ87439.1 hypothetical protein NEQG_02320 [Nematocida parisii ERTm3]KAI5142720.1 hypothetical protein NEPAR07_0246 [Nematocida parisii]EIJ94519.1 hypothetical protein NEPG_00041 [Nematocida parisii ERTm1]KAI5152909.1 hypothetical protein NEPAR06_0030 [Nematocida parisii]KAI5157432.1 hypothetical protein NEPAR05_1271 [Nematocida parisii]|eukprot:XP_013057875.1 hypothetical protein NEPG_00041 [Nematocida parisii ERTm1]
MYEFRKKITIITRKAHNRQNNYRNISKFILNSGVLYFGLILLCILNVQAILTSNEVGAIYIANIYKQFKLKDNTIIIDLFGPSFLLGMHILDQCTLLGIIKPFPKLSSSIPELSPELNESTSVKNEDSTYKYKKSYLSVMKKIFPYSDRDSTNIFNKNPRSFYGFLKNKPTSEYNNSILCWLLILSEGIESPIEIKNNRIILKGENHITLEIPLKNKPSTCGSNNLDASTEDSDDDVYYSDVQEIIEFFINNRNNPLVTNGGIYGEPLDPTKFSMADYIFSPRYLIQLYIYEYLTTIDKLEDFIRMLHSLLVNRRTSPSVSKETGRYAQVIFNKYFICRANFNWRHILLCYLNRLDAALYTQKNYIMPAIPKNTLHSTNSSISIEEKSTQRNRGMERVLLYLFRCFAFDVGAKRYKLDHLQNISTELKEFFNKYDRPNSMDYDIPHEWSRIVSNAISKFTLDLPKNIEIKDTNFLNMFYLTMRLAGISEEAIYIDMFKKSCRGLGDKNENGEINSIVFKKNEKLHMFVQKIFKLFSRGCSNRTQKSKQLTLDLILDEGAKDSHEPNCTAHKIKLKYTRDRTTFTVIIGLYSDGSMEIFSSPIVAVDSLDSQLYNIPKIHSDIKKTTPSIKHFPFICHVVEKFIE